MKELGCEGWARPYRGLIRRPPAACAASSGWCPSGLCGPPEPSACLWTSHRPPWLQEEMRVQRKRVKLAFNLFDRQVNGGTWLRWVTGVCVCVCQYVCLTFVLADFLDPRQRVDLHQRVGHADHMHHVHHTLHTHTEKDIEVRLHVNIFGIKLFWFFMYYLIINDKWAGGWGAWAESLRWSQPGKLRRYLCIR